MSNSAALIHNNDDSLHFKQYMSILKHIKTWIASFLSKIHYVAWERKKQTEESAHSLSTHRHTLPLPSACYLGVCFHSRKHLNLNSGFLAMFWQNTSVWADDLIQLCVHITKQLFIPYTEECPAFTSNTHTHRHTDCQHAKMHFLVWRMVSRG